MDSLPSSLDRQTKDIVEFVRVKIEDDFVENRAKHRNNPLHVEKLRKGADSSSKSPVAKRKGKKVEGVTTRPPLPEV